MKICFVASYLYPYIKGNYPNQHIGGAEYQQQQIIKQLNIYDGIQISVVTLDYGQPFKEIIDGIEIYKTHRPDDGLPLIGFFYPRLLKIWRAIAAANADVYYLRAASFMLLPVSIYCRIRRKKMVYASAHDTDFEPGKEWLTNFRDLWCFKKGIQAANLIITQTENQKKKLKAEYGLCGKVIRNFSAAYFDESQIKCNGTTILWVATIRRFKRPEILLEIAKTLPEYQFVMVGGIGSDDPEYYDEIKEKAKGITNLEFKGFIPPNKVDEIFDSASIFINTSESEGFPNTFLQAWSRGMPVITFFDPDNVVARHNLGAVIQNTADATTAARSLISCDISMRLAIKDYFDKNHSSGVILEYLNTFNKLVNEVGAAS